MKRKLLLMSAACALIASTANFQARADHVPLTQLPDRVQQAIKQQSQGEPLEHVDRDTRDGKTVYQAEFKREGLNRRVTFDANGAVLPERGLSAKADASLDRSPSMTVNQLPAAVQKTVKEQQGGREVADIDKEMWNGKEVYEVEFKEKGPNSRIYVASDGSIVVDKDKDKDRDKPNVSINANANTKRSAYLGTQLSEAPAAVQATVKRTVSNAVIEDVDRETRDGRVVYDVEIKQDGLNRHLKIGEDGALISDSNNSRESRSIGERVRETVGLGRDRRDENLTLDQVPASVQKTIRENCDVGALKPIKRETRDGRVQYDVEYQKEGKNLRMTVGEDGAVVKDNR